MSGSNNVADYARLRDRMFGQIRQTLREELFVELATPIIRKADCGFRPRPNVQLWETRYLREAIGPALRNNLQYLERVFEMGPCFRYEDVDKTHLPEFYMMDLYSANAEFDYIKSLAKRIVGEAFGSAVEECSVALNLRDKWEIDLQNGTEEDARKRLINSLRLRSSSSMYDAFEVFFDRELAPLSRGKAVLFTDLPAGTEVCARVRPGSTCILNRFELFIDGIEIAHGYEDETDLSAFKARASEIGFFNDEQAHVLQLRENEIIPPSAGFAIGVERLCMVASDAKSVSEFILSRQF